MIQIKKDHKQGFTLVEMMVTLVVLIILVTLAVPSFQSVLQRTATISVTNDLIFAMNYARSEALKRNTTVSICATLDQTLKNCGSNWNNGWITFIGTTLASENILRVDALTEQNISINASTNLITYNGSGFAAPGSGNSTFAIYAMGCQGYAAKTITLSMIGRPTARNQSCALLQ